MFCKPPTFSVLAEDAYFVGKRKKHGKFDSILSDTTAHFFIESKTKRLTLNARTLSDTVALDKDLAVMAEAIVQHYKNIRDALDGKTRWKPDALPIFPIILTLEDWFIFSPRVDQMLKKHLDRKLAETNIPNKILDEIPYTIASVNEFELGIQIVAQLGVFHVMNKKTSGDQRHWSFLPFVLSEFKEQMKNVNRYLFEDEWETLIPQMHDGTAFSDIRSRVVK